MYDPQDILRELPDCWEWDGDIPYAQFDGTWNGRWINVIVNLETGDFYVETEDDGSPSENLKQIEKNFAEQAQMVIDRL